MSRLGILFSGALLLFGGCPMFAAEYAVGTCKPTLPSYPNISAAVSSAAAGSTVLVCPGIYAEQVVISKPLTLEGISNGTSAQAVITVPGGGLPTMTSLLFGTVSPQLSVTAGPVNITNISVDGSAFGGDSCTTILAGIYYGSGSSGTVNEVTVRNENNSNCGFGILTENETGPNDLVTIESSSIHDFDYVGIWVDSFLSPGALTAAIKNNYIDGGVTGIYIQSGTLGSVTGNLVAAASQTAIFASSAVSVSSNAVTNSQAGIWIQEPGISVTANKLSNDYVGIEFFESSGMTVKSNTIVNSTVGIEVDCNAGNTVSGNVINDATTGLDFVPSGSNPSDTFLNVATTRTEGCAAAQPGTKSPPNLLNRHRD
jgi:parallel beta-helix repeat protein